MAENLSKKQRLAKQEGIREAMEEHIPDFVENMKLRQQLMPKLVTGIEAFLESGETGAIKDVTPLVKAIWDEDKRLLDRYFGTAVARQESKVTQEIRHVNLNQLIEQRNAAVLGEVSNSSDMIDIPESDIIVLSDDNAQEAE
jgi:hypothetical protein